MERGKQLWPIAAHIDYRLALEAPGPYAATVLHPGVGRFAVAPLTEVAAFGHTWEELAPHVEYEQVAAYLAQERVLRGEDLTDDDRAHLEVLNLPPKLMAWEPVYALASFYADHVETAETIPSRAPLKAMEPADPAILDEPELEDVLLGLVEPWTNESNGAARAVVVEGDARSAASALTYSSLRMAPLTLDEALQRISWASASGGAHGRRRGAAAGRFFTWSAAAHLADVEWPADPEHLHSELSHLRFFEWDEGAAETGWVLRVAVEDPQNGWSAAIGATDLLAEED